MFYSEQVSMVARFPYLTANIAWAPPGSAVQARMSGSNYLDDMPVALFESRPTSLLDETSAAMLDRRLIGDSGAGLNSKPDL